MQIQAADFANVSMSGNYSGINWGSIESRVQERQRNEQMGFDFNTNIQLGQFFGKRTRLSLPFFYSYAVGVINPEYDPFNPDIRLNDYDAATKRERARLGQDYTERRGYNFTNVRKERGANAKARVWNIENVALSYSYNESLHRDFNVEYDRTKIWKGGLNYSYSFQTKPVEPFKSVKFMQKSKWWALIRDMNLYLTPKNISFNNDVMRSYNERKMLSLVNIEQLTPSSSAPAERFIVHSATRSAIPGCASRWARVLRTTSRSIRTAMRKRSATSAIGLPSTTTCPGSPAPRPRC